MPATPDDMERALKELTKATLELKKAQEAQAKVTPAPTTPLGHARAATAAARSAVAEARKKSSELAKELAKANKTDRLGELTAAFRAAKGGASSAAGGDALGGISGLMGAGRAIGTLGKVGGAMGALGPVAAVVGAYIGVAYAANEFRRALDAATRETISHYKELGEVSGAMAAVMASRDVREMMREREKGDRLAGVAGALTDAEQKKNDAAKNLEIAWEELKGGFLYEYQRTLTAILEVMNDVLESLSDYFGKSERIEVPALGDMLRQQRDDFNKKVNKANPPGR